jgi:hypothetical protein
LADYINAPDAQAPSANPKAARIEGLGDYLSHPDTTDHREKCIYSGARGFLTHDHASQKKEMMALAGVSVHSKDPISHYVLSWQQGEQPTPVQVEEAVDLFLDELNLKSHQIFYGLHVDTDNIHLHLMINRVHPDTYKVIQPNKGFDLEAAHRAVARIEHAQGWSREERGRYRVQDDGNVHREHQRPRARQRKPNRPGQNRQGTSHPSRTKSAEQVAREAGAPLIRAATSWSALHERLAEAGMRYERKGSGALLWVGEVAVKASRAGRDCSLTAVQKRLGDYQPAAAELTVAARHPEPITVDTRRWSEYCTEREAFYREKQAAKQALRQRQAGERQALTAAHRQQRNAVFQGRSWRGRGTELNALRSVLAARQAGERADLQEQHRQECAVLLERWRFSFPTYNDWLQASNPIAGIAAKQQHARILRAAEGNDGLVRYDIRAFVAIVYGRRVDYRHQDQTSGLPAFVDRGSEIVITNGLDRNGVLAALQLAAQKWGIFKVEGDSEYQALCVQLAAEHGLRLGNPELQGALQQVRLQQLSAGYPIFRTSDSGLHPK